MKKNLILAAAVAAMALAACSKDYVAAPVPSSGTDLVLGIDNPATRTDVSGTISLGWTEGDVIKVWTGDKFEEMTLTDGSGTTKATFHSDTEFTIPESAFAVYGAEAGDYGNTVTLPDSYVWKEGFFGAPMCGWINQGSDYISMVGGVIKLDIEDIPASAGRLLFTADGQQVSGEFTQSSGAVATVSSATGNTISIDFSAAPAASKRTFYVPVPTGTYHGFKVELQNTAGTALVTRTVSANVTVAKSVVVFAPAFSCSNSSAVVAWEGSIALDWYADHRIRIPASFFETLSAGDKLVLYYSQDEWGQAQIMYGDWSGVVYDDGEVSFDKTFVPTDLYGWSLGDKCSTLTLSQDILDNISAKTNWVDEEPGIGIIIQGSGLTFTKIEIGATPVPETVLWTGSHFLGEAGDWSDSVALNADGLNSASFWSGLKAGKVLTFYYTENPQPGWVNLYVKSTASGWPSISGAMEYGVGLISGSASSSISHELTQDEVDTIKTGGIIIQGVGATVTKITLR